MFQKFQTELDLVFIDHIFSGKLCSEVLTLLTLHPPRVRRKCYCSHFTKAENEMQSGVVSLLKLLLQVKFEPSLIFPKKFDFDSLASLVKQREKSTYHHNK